MRLKRRILQLLVVGGLAVMTTGIASAGGCCIGCEWCGSPAPKAASQTVSAQPGLFSALWLVLSALV